MSEHLGDHGAFDVGRVVGLIQKAAFRHQKIADVLVLRANAQHQRILHHAAAKADAVVHLQHGRGVHHARQLGHHGFFVFAGEVVVVEHLLSAG